MTGKVKFSLVLSFFLSIGIITITILNTGITLTNPNGSKTATIINEIVGYGSDYVYDEKMPTTADPVVIEEGINGLSFTYDGLNYINLSEVKNEVVKVGIAKEGNYSGQLTGYGPDCPGCSSVGNVSCRTYEGGKHSLINDGIYYDDYLYGKVRILAADNSVFPCGTIIKVNNGNLKEFYAVVLDTGATMRKAWSEGVVWMDLAYSSQKEALTAGATSKNTKFSVQRWGW